VGTAWEAGATEIVKSGGFELPMVNVAALMALSFSPVFIAIARSVALLAT
jgi:hypothetical protein